MAGFSVLVWSASSVINLDWLPHWSNIFHWNAVLSPLHSIACNSIGDSALAGSANLVVICRHVCSTQMDLHPLTVSSKITWDLRSLSKLDLRLAKQLLSFRVVKIVCTGWILFSYFKNSLEMLPLYCNTKCCFIVYFCCLMATPELYLLLCSFIRSWLIVSLTTFSTQCLGN